jgi:hypothetical protein
MAMAFSVSPLTFNLRKLRILKISQPNPLRDMLIALERCQFGTRPALPRRAGFRLRSRVRGVYEAPCLECCAPHEKQNEVAAAIAAIERCKDVRVLDAVLARMNNSADRALSADDVTQFRLIAAIAERRLAELRAAWRRPWRAVEKKPAAVTPRAR